jgi:hypothetical protein
VVCLTLQIYNNNGLPLAAAICIPLAVVVVVVLLLLLAHWQRQRTDRWGALPKLVKSTSKQRTDQALFAAIASIICASL